MICFVFLGDVLIIFFISHYLALALAQKNLKLILLRNIIVSYLTVVDCHLSFSWSGNGKTLLAPILYTLYHPNIFNAYGVTSI